jgi:hypothetical protein
MAEVFVVPQPKSVLWLPEPGTERYHQHYIDGPCECEAVCKHKPKPGIIVIAASQTIL